jgi:predicted MFS family arabinose efflux permease
MYWRKLIIWFLLSLFYSYQYVLRVIPAISANDIMVRLGIDASQFGTFCGVYYIGYTAAIIPLSIAIDRYDARKVIVGTIVLVCLGIISLMTDNWYLAIFGRIITGIGSAGAILALFKVISTFFDPKQSSRMLGIAVTIGLLGAIYGGKPLAVLIGEIGFYATITILVALGLAMALATYLLLPKKFSESEDISLAVVVDDIKEIFKNKSLVLLALAGGLMVGPMEGFVDGWSVIAFKTIHSWSDSDATLAPSMIFLGMCLGASVMGIVTERTQRYYTIIGLSSLVMILSFLWIIYGDGEQIQLMLAVLFIVGVACAYQIVVMSKAGLLAGGRLVTTGTAITNMIVMVFGTIYHSLIGNFITNNNSLSGDLYSVQAIQSGIVPLIVGLAAALPLLLLVKKFEK